MLYDRIKDICLKKGRSIASVESEANLSKGSIGKWNTSSPTVRNLKAVAKVLNVKMEDLLEAEKS